MNINKFVEILKTYKNHIINISDKQCYIYVNTHNKKIYYFYNTYKNIGYIMIEIYLQNKYIFIDGNYKKIYYYINKTLFKTYNGIFKRYVCFLYNDEYNYKDQYFNMHNNKFIYYYYYIIYYKKIYIVNRTNFGVSKLNMIKNYKLKIIL